MNRNVYLRETLPSPSQVASSIGAGVEAVGAKFRSNDRWAVKLNLTYPRYLPGVVNSPAFVEGLCQWAHEERIRLELVEGDGGNGSYSAADTFRGNGIADIAARYGAKCVSLSEGPWSWRETLIQGRTVRLPYSAYFERREFDRFVVAPLFKNHVFTVATLGMKNLWGCIPDPYRMYYHHCLDHGIVALAQELAPDFSIFDGLVALRGRGPMDGKPLDWNLVMVSSDLGTGEAAALRLMGIPLESVNHLQIAHACGLVPEEDQVEWLSDPSPFARQDFLVDRSLFNRISIALSRFPSLMRIVYHSSVSGVIYRIVNSLRSGSAQAELVKAKQDGLYEVRPITR